MKHDARQQTVVFALGGHPDDIEFMMAGTLFLLKEAGAQLHYMNLANGNCGTPEYGRAEIEAIREQEGKNAAAFLDAAWYESIENDIEVLYDLSLVRKVASVVRSIAPDIMLIPALHDYMEDHMNTARIGATAAFTRGMPNFQTDPETAPVQKELALYHALPYGLYDSLNNKIHPHFFVNIADVIGKKEKMLAFHESQRKWLVDSQGLDSYLKTMREMSVQVGKDSGCFEFAEGWIRHNPLGYSRPDYAPLEDLLADYCAW